MRIVIKNKEKIKEFAIEKKNEGKTLKQIMSEIKENFGNEISIGSLHSLLNESKDENNKKDVRLKQNVERFEDGTLASEKVFDFDNTKLRTDKDLLIAHCFDPTLFEVTTVKDVIWEAQTPEGIKVLNSNRLGIKTKDKPMFDEELFKRIEDKFLCEDDSLSNVKYGKGNKMAVIAIRDFHLGLLSWAKETGSNYDIKIAKNLYNQAIDYFANVLKDSKGIEKIILVSTDDFFHTDNTQNTTQKGTPQTVDARWYKMFEEGTDLLYKNILKLGKIAPVFVPFVPGNHSPQTTYASMKILEAKFKNTKSITIDTSVRIPMKVVKYGVTGLGFTHGDMSKKQLKEILHNEAKKISSECKFMEVHSGHLHSINAFEEAGVIYEQDGTIGGHSDWEKSKGYNSKRACYMRIYDKEFGKESIHTFVPERIQDKELRKELNLDETIEEQDNLFILD